jgi:5'-nucleotidase
MPRQMGHLRILFSARVLLDLEAADQVYGETYKTALAETKDPVRAKAAAVSRYEDYVACRGEFGNDPFDPEVRGRRFGKGPLFDLALALSRLNEGADEPLVEIGLSAKDEAETGITIFRNLDQTVLGDRLDYRLLTCGHDVTKEFHDSFGTDLFLSRNTRDVQYARDRGIASAWMNFPDNWDYDHSERTGPLKIMVDGDGVAWGEESEQRFREQLQEAGNLREGLSRYIAMEDQDFARPMAPGPFTRVLEKISKLNDRFPRDEAPFTISLLTARGGKASTRALTTLFDHDIALNGFAEFRGGAAKADGLRAHDPDLYFDDQETHLSEGRLCPAGLVFYVSDSPLGRQ